MNKKQKVLIIVGPTSSGKSALAVELARRFDGEIISADSRQVYRGLDIGTGKITKREMKGVPHHLLDIASPKKDFSADDFVRHGRTAIEDISSRGKLPIVTGGTGFYIDALVGRIVLPNVPPNKKLRALLENKSTTELFAMLQKSDPRRARNIDRHNKRRLIRALEIVDSIGRVPMIDLRNQSLQFPYFDVCWLGVALQSKVLERRIHERLTHRIRLGMIAEAKRLHKQGLSYKRMEELGLEYRALASLLQNKTTRPQMIEKLNRDIRRYAKRQLTYWKRNNDILWFKPSERQRMSKTVREWLKK
ncbi:MAG: tRNA (adenosine(37)-N6)-dimethylallyltransferase MiaA [bacterium]|nr:tRNA (adenosine(37)-N6)-dimethylallyltransferase MiaA [bacterium]